MNKQKSQSGSFGRNKLVRSVRLDWFFYILEQKC